MAPLSEFNPALKLLLQTERLSAFARDEWMATPVHVEISPTNRCPASCQWCFYSGTHSAEHLPLPELLRALDDMAEMGVEAISWTGGGDPSVYPQINDAVEYAHRIGLKQGMFTNGYKPIQTPELLQWVRLTITDLVRVPKSAGFYAERTKAGVVVNLAPDNEPHLPRLVEEAKAAGVAYLQVRPALADHWSRQTAVSCPEWLKNHETDAFRVVLTDYKFADYQRPHRYPTCHGHRFVPFVWHNGDVAVCAYHFGKPEFTFGNLKDGGFRGVWESERRRSMLAAGIGVIPECQHCCKLHEINKPLAVLAGDVPGPADVEFV